MTDMGQQMRPKVVAALVDAHTRLHEDESFTHLLLVEAEHQPTELEQDAARRDPDVQDMPVRRAKAKGDAAFARELAAAQTGGRPIRLVPRLES